MLNQYLNKIINAESFNFMDILPENSVDLVIADGPYSVTTHKWDKVKGGIQEFNLKLIQKASRILKPGGAMYLFGKADCIDFIDYRPYMNLNSKIIWYQPSRLAQGRISYTNNYDIIAYFIKEKATKGKGRANCFNLDDIRVPHLVELTQRKRCESVPSVKNGKFGKTKFNTMGKNPGDVWGDIKQLTYRSKELIDRKMLNTIQKPEKLIERLIKASSSEGDIIFDPFVGTGTVHKLAKQYNRQIFGCELDPVIAQMAYDRVIKAGYSIGLEKDKMVVSA